jgi:type II secretory pathway pseudopilin PulG
MCRRRYRRGFLMADIAIGMVVIGVIAAVLGSAVVRARAAEERLAETRAAGRLAEHVLLNLQHHQPPPPAPAGANINVRKMTDAIGGTWAAVDVDVHGRRATLFGIVPGEATR